MNNAIEKIQGGFTLIETLMAVLLLSLAIAGPLTIASKSLEATLTAKDQDTAFYLAQDGMEYVRWVRDTNTLEDNKDNTDWLAGLDGTTPTPTNFLTAVGNCANTTGTQSCTIDSYANTVSSCTTGASCPVINYSWATLSGVNYFSHFTYAAANGTTITPSVFTRTISIETPVGSNNCTTGHGCEASVTVTVSWCDQASVCGGTPRTVTLREELLNWQP